MMKKEMMTKLNLHPKRGHDFYQKPKWDEDNGNGGPGGMGARCRIPIA